MNEMGMTSKASGADMVDGASTTDAESVTDVMNGTKVAQDGSTSGAASVSSAATQDASDPLGTEDGSVVGVTLDERPSGEPDDGQAITRHEPHGEPAVTETTGEDSAGAQLATTEI
ncbi:hypothetical protein F443_16627, partial [Phytophthora nicotianae P1569]